MVPLIGGRDAFLSIKMYCSQKKLTLMYNRLYLHINSQVLTQFLIFYKTSTSKLHS